MAISIRHSATDPSSLRPGRSVLEQRLAAQLTSLSRPVRLASPSAGGRPARVGVCDLVRQPRPHGPVVLVELSHEHPARRNRTFGASAKPRAMPVGGPADVARRVPRACPSPAVGEDEEEDPDTTANDSEPEPDVDDSNVDDPAVLSAVADAALARVERLEAARSRLDGRIVDAYAALRRVSGQLMTALERQRQVAVARREAQGESGPGRVSRRSGGTGLVVDVDELVVSEIVAACAVPSAEVWRRLRLAVAPGRYGPLRDRLETGAVSLMHATLIASECAALAEAEGWEPGWHDQVVAQVTDRVLAVMPDGSAPSHAQIRSRLTRVLAGLRDPGKAAARRAQAVSRRSLRAQVTEEGMGTLVLNAPAEQVVAVMDRVEGLARSLRQAGDPRTLEQLRADLALEALLRHGYGPCPSHSSTPAPAAPSRAGPLEPSQHDPPDQLEHQDQLEDLGGRDAGVCGCAPVAPAARVWIVVPFEVATGASDAVCELPGHGWVTAEHARQMITAAGSQWRWLGVDQLTGRALHLSSERYRPTRAMIEQVRALDGHCRAPGCTIAAHRCDVDHHLPYPAGPTAIWNLGPLDRRRHHNPKTAGLWSCRPANEHPTPPELPQLPGQSPPRGGGRDRLGPGGYPTGETLAARTGRGLWWRTLTGREYVTYPASWTEALHDPTHPDQVPPTRRGLTERRRRESRRQARHDPDLPPPF